MKLLAGIVIGAAGALAAAAIWFARQVLREWPIP